MVLSNLFLFDFMDCKNTFIIMAFLKFFSLSYKVGCLFNLYLTTNPYITITKFDSLLWEFSSFLLFWLTWIKEWHLIMYLFSNLSMTYCEKWMIPPKNYFWNFTFATWAHWVMFFRHFPFETCAHLSPHPNHRKYFHKNNLTFFLLGYNFYTVKPPNGGKPKCEHALNSGQIV